MRFELTTSTLARLRSTPELYPHCVEHDLSSIVVKKMQALFFYLSKILEHFLLWQTQNTAETNRRHFAQNLVLKKDSLSSFCF